MAEVFLILLRAVCIALCLSVLAMIGLAGLTMRGSSCVDCRVSNDFVQMVQHHV
jgi:hypothetical protein